MVWFFVRSLTRRLLAWSGISIAFGLIALTGADPFWRGFGLQALLWGVIDAAIALLGGRGLDEKLRGPVELGNVEREALRFRRILWVNAGLDVLYVAGGLALAFTAGSGDLFQRGMGWGVVAQGAFLLVFDLIHALTVPDELFVPDLGLFTQPWHQPQTQLGEGQWAAVLVHGFPGTPFEMRDLADELAARGWTTETLLLPGFGVDLRNLFQQRVAGWVEVIAAAVQRWRGQGKKVLLVGFSLGGGLSALAAPRVHPDGLALLAPFWIPEPLWLRGLVAGLGLFVPGVIRPFAGLPLTQAMLTQGSGESAPEIDVNNPAFVAGLRNMRVPLVVFEQFREIGRQVGKIYGHGPVLDGRKVLVLRGQEDDTVRAAPTRRLAEWIGAQYRELPGGHHIFMRSNPGFPAASEALIEFAAGLEKS